MPITGKVTFWQLRDIKGNMVVTDSSEVKELDFKQLKTTGDAIDTGLLYDCPDSLEAIYMPKLVGVGSKGTADGYVHVEECAALYKFHAPKLQYVSNHIHFSDNEKLYEISFPHLKMVGVEDDMNELNGNIVINNNANLKMVYLPKAQAVDSDEDADYVIRGNPKLEFVMYKTNKVATFDFDAAQNVQKSLVMHGVPSKHGLGDYWEEFLWEKKMDSWVKVDDLKYEKLDLTHNWDEKFDWLEDMKDEKEEKLEHLWDDKWDWVEDKKEEIEDVKHEIEEHFEEKKEYNKVD